MRILADLIMYRRKCNINACSFFFWISKCFSKLYRIHQQGGINKNSHVIKCRNVVPAPAAIAW